MAGGSMPPALSMTQNGPAELPTPGAVVIPGKGNDTYQRTGVRREAYRNAALESLGSVVYAARLEDGSIKIGHTEHFGSRLRWLKSYTSQEVELLAFRPGTYTDEQSIHARLVEFRAPHTEQAREYYHPTPEVMAVVNDMRAEINMPPLAA